MKIGKMETEKMKTESEQKIYACWLDSIYWLSARAKYKLLKAAGSVQGIYAMSEQQAAAVIGEKGGERFGQQKKRYHPYKVWNYIRESGICYTCCTEPDFPRRLAAIPDPPFGIFYKGRLPDENAPAVAMIGARKCSEYGRCMAERFAAGFAQSGVDVISGMALGIDSISQKMALRAGGSSYAVLGCGVDIVYPKGNEQLYGQLIEKGGILSEYPPQMQPKPALFPPRNRIISALSDAVVVLEAREKSGTLITVDMALEQGKEVYAVPGRCTDDLSMGCNRLLRQGAQIAVSPEDIIADMHWEHRADFYMHTDAERKCAAELPASGARVGKKEPSSPTRLHTDVERKCTAEKEKGLSETAKEVYAALDSLPLTQDEIVAKLRDNKSAVTVPQICQGLVELELKGLAVSRNRQYRLSCL